MVDRDILYDISDIGRRATIVSIIPSNENNDIKKCLCWARNVNVIALNAINRNEIIGNILFIELRVSHLWLTRSLLFKI